MSRFSDEIQKRVLVADGAMGTMLYSKGIFINRCFDELNLSMPALVKEIHQSYVHAGAEVLETNTFGANALKLAKHGFRERLRDINIAGVKLARESAGSEGFVAGAVGPLGIHIEPLGKTSFAEAREVFREQIQALVEGGVDLILFETFGNINELREAIFAAREICDLPVVAQMTIDDDGRAPDGTAPAEFARRLDEYGATVIGVNCSVGPVVMLEAIEAMARATTRPLSAQPNAGKPRNVEGRNLYLASPEYMADYAKLFINAGAKLIGGCCGTTPEHIKWIRNYVRSTTPGKRRFKVETHAVEGAEALPVPPFEQRSTLGRKIREGKFVAFVEILPPRGSNPRKELDSAAYLKQHGVDAINIPDGPRASARMSNQALAVMMQQQVGVETVLHYCCRDRNVISMQSDLLGAYALGIRNVILITGDPPKLGNYPDATAVFDVDAIGLTNLANNLNRGLDLGGNAVGSQTGFLIGVGANPGNPNFEEEIRRLEWKVQAGADYIVTQPVFDIQLIDNFLKAIAHVRVPLIAGIWPLVSYRQAEFMQNELRVAVPENIRERMRSATSAEAAKREGLDIAKEMVRGLYGRIEGIQISVLGRNEPAVELLRTAQELSGERRVEASATVQ